MTSAKITSSALLQYGMLAIPVAFAGFPLYVLAPDFYATQHSVSLTSLGMVLLALRLFDAFQDPLIGYGCDRYRRYTPVIMTLASIILCVSVYGLFNQLYFSPLIWFVCCMGGAVTAYSVLSINLSALGALCTMDSHQQTRIAVSREAFGLVGLVIAVSLPGLLANGMQKEQIYQQFSLVLIALMVIGLFCFLRWCRNQPYNTSCERARAPSFFVTVKTFSSDSKKLLWVYLVSMTASSIPVVLVTFFIRDLLGAETYMGLFLLLYFLSGVCFMPFWRRLSLICGKYRAWLFAMMLSVASFVWAFTLNPGDIWQYAVICVASGMALGADLVFPPSILADQVHMLKKQEETSMHYAFLTFIAKASLACASAVALPLLESAGFVPNAKNSAAALMVLSAAYALIPCVLKCGAAGLLWRILINSKEGITHENNHINSTIRSSHHV